MYVGIIGSCLSNLPAAFLMGDYGWTRLNNAAANRSDLFISQVINGAEPPALETLQAYLGVDPGAADVNRYLIENYRHCCGMTEIDPSWPGLWANLHSARFDVLLLDNLADIAQGKLRYRGDQFAPFELSFPLHLGTNGEAIHPDFEVLAQLSGEESADNWATIIRFLKRVQPQARLIFSSAPYGTAVGDPGRYERAMSFHNALVNQAANLDVEILPPTVLPVSMTKLPNDRDHFDMAVYRAIAGYIHISTLSGWSNWTNRPLPPEIVEAAVDHSVTPGHVEAPALTLSPVRLQSVVAGALSVPEDRVGEDAAMGRTERWDSLKQIGVVLAVEEAFAVRLPFAATTDAVSISTLRTALRAVGVQAADQSPTDDHITTTATNASPASPSETLGPDRPIVLPVNWNLADPGRNLFADFASRAMAQPDAPYALFVKGGVARRLSNGQILAGAVAIAERLAHVPRGDTVAIILDHSPELYTAFIGCVLAGLCPTILAPKTPRQDPAVFQESMAVLFERVQPAAVVASHLTIGSAPTSTEHLIVNDLAPAPLHEVAAFVASLPLSGFSEKIAFLQHSSGTTGHKKGVMLTHHQALEQTRLYASAIGLSAGDRIASWLPLYHDMGLISSFILPTIIGCPIISLDAQEWVLRPTMLLDYIDTEKANFCWQPNFAFLHTARNDRGDRVYDLTSMKLFVNCSEPCRANAFDVFHERYASAGVTMDMLQVSYAMAENVFAVTQTSPGRPARRSLITGSDYLSSGHPLPGVEIRILNADGIEVPHGEVGEICLRSTSMFSGYYRLPDITAERVVKGWYMTRDLGRMDDGELFVIGRTDDLVIINGKNIVAHEVEDQIGVIPGLAPGRILTAGLFNEETGTSELIVLAERTPDGLVDDASIQEQIRASVFASTGVAPASVALLPRGYLVKSSSGKLARKKSLEKYSADGASAPSGRD